MIQDRSTKKIYSLKAYYHYAFPQGGNFSIPKLPHNFPPKITGPFRKYFLIINTGAII